MDRGAARPQVAVTEGKLAALSLLELPVPVQEQVEQGFLARRPPRDPKIVDRGEQEELATRVVRDKLTREETSRAVRERKGAGRPARATLHRAEFATADGRVTVAGPAGGVIAALEEALIQARAGQRTPGDTADAEAA
ncbi:MAG: hypothetical protein WKF75_18115 [Singulisphaera sp.]